MLERLDALERELSDVEARLGDPDLAADRTAFVEITRRHAELTDVVGIGRALRTATEDADAARTMIAELSGDDREEMRDELRVSEAAIVRATDAFRLALLPKDPNDGRAVIMEIRGAEGGEEANLFARDLYDMYVSYAKRQRWSTDVLGSKISDRGGFAEVTLSFSGPDAWTRLKHEAGPHRVQRVPETESQGRVHTSSATVIVLPEADEVDIEIDQNDLQIDTYRSSGAGGQHVNTTDSAVRVTHVPTGITVSMQDEKSQLQNRERAMVVLRSRLLAAEQDKAASEASDARRAQIGGGGRSEKIRTYNFKENRVTDHRIGLTIHKLDRVLAGELDDVVDALVADERTRQLAADG